MIRLRTRRAVAALGALVVVGTTVGIVTAALANAPPNVTTAA